MLAWYARPSAPTASAEVGAARAARSAFSRESRRAAGSCENFGSGGSCARYRASRTLTAPQPAALAITRIDAATRRARLRLGARGSGLRAARSALPRRATIPPQHHPRHPVVRRADVHAAGHEVGGAVAVQIRG